MLLIPIITYKPLPNLSFSSLARYLTLGRVSPHAFSKEGPRHFSIYHYITGQSPIFRALAVVTYLRIGIYINESLYKWKWYKKL